MIIREIRETDAPGLHEVLVDIGWFKMKNVEEEIYLKSVKEMIKWSIERDDHLILISEEGGELTEYTSVHFLPYLFMGKPEGYVGELFVKTVWRGKGFGSELLRRAINEARERGCCCIRLINIRDRESYRRGFYAKQGWQERTDAADFMMKLD